MFTSSGQRPRFAAKRRVFRAGHHGSDAEFSPLASRITVLQPGGGCGFAFGSECGSPSKRLRRPCLSHCNASRAPFRPFSAAFQRSTRGTRGRQSSLLYGVPSFSGVVSLGLKPRHEPKTASVRLPDNAMMHSWSRSSLRITSAPKPLHTYFVTYFRPDERLPTRRMSTIIESPVTASHAWESLACSTYDASMMQ